jgi:hypothetical protein
MTTVLCTNAFKAASKAKKSAAKPDKRLPVTSHMLLHFHEGYLLVTPFAWEEREEKTEKISARTDETSTWATCVPVKPFVDWLRVTQNPKKWEEDQIHLTFDPQIQTLKIRAGNTRAEFKCLDAQEFLPC